MSLEMRELSLETLGSVAIRSVRKFCCHKGSKVDIRTFVHDVRVPLPVSRLSADALESVTVISLCACIALLLAAGRHPEIMAAIVKRVMVAMVALKFIAVLQAQNLAVHPHLDSRLTLNSLELAHGVKAVCVVVPISVPLPLREGIEVLRVNFRKLTLRKWNQLVFWVWGCHVGLTSDVALAGCLRIRQPHYIAEAI